jgi:hypothetical protein
MMVRHVDTRTPASRAWQIAAACALVLLPAVVLAAPKTDVLVFKNGDRLTGEIKGLDRGKLSFKTDATGTISIEWDDIARLVSNQNLRLETVTGGIHVGQLAEAGSPNTLRVVETGQHDLPIDRVVRMAPIVEDSVLGRFDGEVYGGYTLVSGDDSEQLNLGGDVTYRTDKVVVDFSGDATSTNSDAAEKIVRAKATLQANRLLPDRWYAGGIGRLERNDDLGTDLRASIGAGVGRYLIQTNRQVWQVTAGLLLTREASATDDAVNSFVEGYAAVGWDWFRFDDPELDLSSGLALFPDFSGDRRVRGTYNLTLMWELLNDFYWRINLSSTYDTQPPDAEAKRFDYSFDTSLSWKF